MSGKGNSEGIVKRGEGRYAVVMYEGKQPVRRCLSCRARFWVSDHPGKSCARCHGELGPVADAWRQRWHGPYPTLKEAKAQRIALLRRQQQGEYVAPDKLTVGEYLVRWLAGTDVKPTTRESYRANIETHLIPGVGSVRLQALSVAQVNALYRAMETSGRRDGKGLSKKSVRNCHVVLRKALGDAVDEGLVTRNVAALAKPPKQTRRSDHRVWTAEQLGRFLGHVAEERLSALWVLLATTGMRRGEAIGLRWRSVDLDAGRLSVVESIVPVGYRPEVSQGKTNSSARWIDLDAGTVAALRAHKKAMNEERMALGLGRVAGEEYVFVDVEHGPLHPQAVSAMFERHGRQAGLPHLNLHGLRHSWASIALANGVPPKVVSERLGHASVAFTMQQYQSVLPGMQKEAAEHVAGLIFGR